MIVLACENRIIQLRVPGLRSYEFDFKVSYLRDMSGNLHTRKQTPGALVHEVSVEILTYEQLNAFRTFLFAVNGKQIKYTDNEGATWQVRILDDPVSVAVQDNIRKGVFTLRMEGTYSG